MARYLILLGLALLASACAGRGETPYGPMGPLGGYQEDEAGPDTWWIYVRSRDPRAEGFSRAIAEYRAGELLKARGFEYVQILDDHGRWELSEDLGGGRRRVLSDELELTVRGVHDYNAPRPCRSTNSHACATLAIDPLMKAARRKLRFVKKGS